MLISVHIPKTGGSSFRTLLKSHFGDRLLLDYTDHPMSMPTVCRNMIAIKGMLKALRLLDKFECVHGHFLPVKYRVSRRNIFIIWFRDPIQRVISRYYHYVRQNQQPKRTHRRYPKNQDLTIEQFCNLKRFHNTYHKYLWCFNIDRFAFVGIIEKYESSIEIFRRMFNIKEPAILSVENVNFNKKTTEYYNVSKELSEIIYRTNSKDIEIYKKALLINEKLERKYLG